MSVIGRVAGAARRLLPVPSLTRARDMARATVWLVPAACTAIAVGMAVGLVALDHLLAPHQVSFAFPGPPSGARSFLSSIIQAMISFTGVVFSITVVVLQLSSGQFSPRVLRTFLADLTIQITLGVFVATFVYALVVLRAVRGSTGNHPMVPRTAVSVALLFVLASVFLFIRYIAHVTNLVRVATIIDLVGSESRRIIRARYPDEPRPAGRFPPLGPPLARLTARRAGVLVSVNEAGLVRLAASHRCVVVIAVRVGDFVPAGAVLATVHPTGHGEVGAGPGGEPAEADRRRLGEDIHRLLASDTERTMEQDLAYGFRQLVDIANRALSPSVNDPTTAVQVLDALHDLLRALAGRRLPDGRWCDDEGELRLVVPQYDFAAFVELAVAEILHYGSEAAQVPGRIRSMLDDLRSAALVEHRGALDGWRDRVRVPGG